MTSYRYSIPDSMLPAKITAIEEGEEPRILLAFHDVTEGETEVIHNALIGYARRRGGQKSEPSPEAPPCGTSSAPIIQHPELFTLQPTDLEKLQDFCKAGFKLAKRRLNANCTTAQYIEQMATMNVYKDVIDFIGKDTH